jgi:hypothetical protein
MNNIVLANRPLPPNTENFSSYKKKGSSSAVDDLYKSNFDPVYLNYNQKDKEIIPISIKQSEANNDFMILEDSIYEDVEEYIKEAKKGNVIKDVSNKPEPKMNMITRFYVGSLTVIGLFIFYRLIRRTR